MSSEDVLTKNIRRLIETLDAADALVSPISRSIEHLLRLSAGELGSAEASVLIRVGDGGDLRFFAVIGEVADQLRDMMIPAGKGIAGFVFSSGQPLAVSDAAGEESFYAEVDKRTGYSTQILLATPLRHQSEVIGVLEYINRRGEPPYEPFTPEEMDKAAMYAEAIAPLVNAYETASLFKEMRVGALAADAEIDSASVREWLAGLRGSAEHREMIDLAVLIRDVAGRGDAERTLCRRMLEAILNFSERRGETEYKNL